MLNLTKKSFIILTAFLPQASWANDFLTEAQLADVLSQVAPGMSIVAEEKPINKPLIYFVVQGGSGSVSDIEKEDVFTNEKEYDYSVAYCELSIVFFTPVHGSRIFVGSDAGETFPQTLALGIHRLEKIMNYNFWVGGFSSTNMLETKLDEEGGFSISPGKTSATSQSSIGKFDSRMKAEEAVTRECGLSDAKKIELYNLSFGVDGILIEGQSKREPFFGNSRLILLN